MEVWARGISLTFMSSSESMATTPPPAVTSSTASPFLHDSRSGTVTYEFPNRWRSAFLKQFGKVHPPKRGVPTNALSRWSCHFFGSDDAGVQVARAVTAQLLGLSADDLGALQSEIPTWKVACMLLDVWTVAPERFKTVLAAAGVWKDGAPEIKLALPVIPDPLPSTVAVTESLAETVARLTARLEALETTGAVVPQRGAKCFFPAEAVDVLSWERKQSRKTTAVSCGTWRCVMWQAAPVFPAAKSWRSCSGCCSFGFVAARKVRGGRRARLMWSWVTCCCRRFGCSKSLSMTNSPAAPS